MLQKVKNFIQHNNLIIAGDCIVTGVSGGPDSIALLYILNEIKEELAFRLVAVHVNHSLRDQADHEEAFVRRCCLEWQIPFYVQKVDVRAYAEKSKISVEEAGRECRYKFFRKIKQKVAGTRVATAHHQDDNAETVLFHVLRGTGIKGLRGIMPVSGDLIRPLLGVNKEQILNFLTKQGLSFCLDHTNFDSRYTRNRIRNILIPQIKKQYNPNIVSVLNQLASIAREENDYLEKQSVKAWNRVVESETDDAVIINLPRLRLMHFALQSRIIMLALAKVRGSTGWKMADAQKLISLSGKEGSSKKIILRKGLEGRKEYEQLIITTRKQQEKSFCHLITGPGTLVIPETGEAYEVYLCSAPELKNIGQNFTVVDYDLVKKPLYLRSRRPGDIFYPAGAPGKKKIKDYFIDIKLPLKKRDMVPLLASEQQVYAVVGFRVSQLAVVTEKTRRAMAIRKKDYS